MSYKDYEPHFVLLSHNSKIPPKGYSFKNRDPKTKEIMKHLDKGGNLGLLAQPNFVFVDIDSPQSENHSGADGLNNFWQWCDEHGINLEDIMEQTLVQKTPTGGIHLIFLKPQGYEVKQDIAFLDGVDIKASKNNYILIQPSKINGKSYAFEDKNKDPIELPQALAKAIQNHVSKKTTKAKVVNKESDGLMYRNDYTKYPVLDVFYNIEHGFGDKGIRNDNLFTWSTAIRKITDYETAYKYAQIANQNTPDPISDDELVSTLKSAYSYDSLLETFEESGTIWVKVNIRRSMDNYAVLKTKYDQVGSKWAEDYDDEDLYLYDELYKGSNFKTVFNYKGDE